MMARLSSLWLAPEVNPIDRKARSIPVLNPVNLYGRVFFFSWFGFMVAFWAWYAFPPLLTHTIKADLGLTPAQVANSNIVSLVATLLIRFAAGPLCDQFGARVVFGGTLLLGAIPLGLAPLVRTAGGLYASRFCIGLLGGSFVPCQVWTTAFFDRAVVGSANALTAGWGNAGGGLTYFIMPALLDALVARGLGPGPAWRLAFLAPLLCVLATGAGLLLLCPDTPTGSWSERDAQARWNLQCRNGGVVVDAGLVDVPGGMADKMSKETSSSPTAAIEEGQGEAEAELEKKERKHGADWDHHATLPEEGLVRMARGEVVVVVAKPTVKETLRVLRSPQTVFLMATYFCSFGGELAINSVLGAYYARNFPRLGQTAASEWAAMFGFLNVATRPLGGVVADVIYRYNKSKDRGLWGKKVWIVSCGLLSGVMLVLVGALDPRDEHTMFGLVGLVAVFLEAGNGANFALIPHLHPRHNGLVSGCTGAAGNLGGIVFAIIFRFVDAGSNYPKVFWLMGIIHIALNLALSWLPPLPSGQAAGQ